MPDRWATLAIACAGTAALAAAAGLLTYALATPDPPPDIEAREPQRAPTRATSQPTARPPETVGTVHRQPAADHHHAPTDFRVVPGSTVATLLVRLAGDHRVTFDLTGTTPGTLMRRLGLGDRHAEGHFLPGSYATAHRRTASSLLREAHERMRTTLADAWRRRPTDLPYTRPHDALVLASIVEKETAHPADRRRIAAVFVRRLRRGMRLQADPTVIYGLADAYDPPLLRHHLTVDTPHNTYTRHGLPPTPISLPGRAAIEAALSPAPGTALFFVARGDGSSEFSDTLAEHNAAVNRYLRRAPSPRVSTSGAARP